MSKLKKMVVVATSTAVVTGLAFNVAIQTANAASKKYTVTVKYVGDDKKTLKTVKKTVKAGTKYKLAKLSSKDKAVHNYAYKSGSKTIKVTKSASYKVTYKRTAYDIKFMSYKSNATKPYATSKVINIKKGKSYTYQGPLTSGYDKPVLTVKPTKDATYKVKAKPAVVKSTVKKEGIADGKFFVQYDKYSNGEYRYYLYDGTNFLSTTIPSSTYIEQEGAVNNKKYSGYYKLGNGQYYYAAYYGDESGFTTKITPANFISDYVKQAGVADRQWYNGYYKLSNGQYYYVEYEGDEAGLTTKTVPSYDYVDKRGVADNQQYIGYYKLKNGQYYYVADGNENFTTKTAPSDDYVDKPGVVNNKTYQGYYKLSTGQYYYVASYYGNFTTKTAPRTDYVNKAGIADNLMYIGYYQLRNGQYYYARYSGYFISNTTPGNFASDYVEKSGVVDNKRYVGYYNSSNGQYFYVTDVYKGNGFISDIAPNY
ncbi:MAG TPA: hypothetical protein VGM95_06890 [Lactobacillaceae bacterium]|jgi:hypothetical protein